MLRADMDRSVVSVKEIRSEILVHMVREDKQNSSQSEEDIHLRAAANYIRSGHYREALNVLGGIKDRGALWYFYSASANPEQEIM